jgi:hypothetical protein
MVDYSRHLLSYRFIHSKRAFPTPQSQEPCYYRLRDSFHSPIGRLGDLDVTPLYWPIAVALDSSLDYGRLSHSLRSLPLHTGASKRRKTKDDEGKHNRHLATSAPTVD